MNEPMLKSMPAAIGSVEFFDRARARLNFDVPAGLTDASVVPASGDQGTDRMLQIVAREQPIRPAAVLIPVVDHPQPTVLLTQRSAHLNDHAGQISFPGGKIDPTDISPLDAALREAWEEVGLVQERDHALDRHRVDLAERVEQDVEVEQVRRDAQPAEWMGA